MRQKILLIGQNRVGKTSLSNLLLCCDLSDYEFNHVRSIDRAKTALYKESSNLVIINGLNLENVKGFLHFLRKNNAESSVLLIAAADRQHSQSLIKDGVQHIISPDQVNQISLMQCILSVLEHKRIENELRKRDEILQAVDFAAEIFLSQMDWESRINDVMERLGQATQTDRVYVYKIENQGETDLSAVLQAEWIKIGIHQSEKILNAIESESWSNVYARWMETFRNGEAVFGNVFDLPPQEQSHLLKTGIRSLAVVPIFSNQILWGFIGFDHCCIEKTWSSTELDALKTAAKIIGAAVTHQEGKMQLMHLATHDYLTNLPNRMLLEDRFALAVSRSERSGKKFGVIAIDLDKFKNVNDTYGHPFGDKVLIEIAWRLSDAVRSSDTCARVGGDEFTVLAEGIENKKDLIRVMEKLNHSLTPDISIDGKQLQITASMGASIYPNHGTEMEQLMKAADIALYQIKDTYSGFKVFIDDQYAFFNS